MSSGLITVSNNQIYDKYVNGVWQNPYQNNTVFALSAPLDLYNSNGTYAVQAILPSSLWLTNSGSLVNSLQADFADGQGFRTLTKDQTYNLSYSSGGTKTWTFKLTLTNSTVLQSQTDFVFDSTSGGFAMNHKPIHTQSLASRNKWDNLFHFPGGSSTPVVSPLITADASYYGQAATGWYTIKYANADGKLHKPLIVAEGFDYDDVLKPEEQFGSSNITTFIAQINSSHSTNLINLLTTTSSEQYDIVYVDWKHSGDFIERNALLLEKIIGIVNAQSGNAPIIVMGQSMGCLVSRWALRDMENKGINHHCRLFISFDGPHLGANIPLAFQYAARQGRTLYYKQAFNSLLNEYNTIATVINSGTTLHNLLKTLFTGAPPKYLPLINQDVVRGGLGLLDEPSVREMLINYVNSGYQVDNTIHNDWQQSLDYPSVGNAYPQGFTGQPCALVAVSNGSECAATQPFSPGQALLSFNGNANTRFLGDIVGSLAVPFLAPPFLIKNPAFLLATLPGKNTFTIQFTLNAQPDGVAALQYSGKITYTKKLLNLINISNTITSLSVTSSPSILPYDYFPGGEVLTKFDSLTNISNQTILAKYNLTFTAKQPSFCLTPVPSVLDLGKGQVALTKADYLTPYIGAQPPAGSKSSPFANGFTTAFSVVQGSANNNEIHLQITPRNGDWIYNQIMGTPIQSNCSIFCGYNTIAISGAPQFCGSSNYNLTGTLPPAANTTIMWSSSPSGLTFNPSNGTTTTVSGTVGSTTLQAAIIVKEADGEVCGTAYPILPITAGAPTVYASGAPYGSCNGNTQTWSLTASPALGSNWNWQAFPSNGASIYIRNNGSPTAYADVIGGGTISLSYTDVCGAAKNIGGPTVYSSCHAMMVYQVTPNPAQSQVTVSTDNTNTNMAKTNTTGTTQSMIYAIKITDQYGVTRKSLTYKSGVASTNIPVADLNPGSYLVSVFDGTQWNSQTLLIQR